MNEFWYPWYPGVFFADTMHLSAEQDGIYRRLIDHYMKTRSALPDNDIALSRIAGVSEIKWLDASSIVRAFFKHKAGMLYHPFCDQQLDVQDKKMTRLSERAKKASSKRWQSKQEDTCIKHTTSIPQAMLVDATRQDKREKELTNVSSKKSAVKRGTRIGNEIPDGQIPDGYLSWALGYAPFLSEEQVRDHWQRFYDYWIGVAGAKGAKLDWQATWRNGLKNQLDWSSKNEKTGRPHEKSKSERADDAIAEALAELAAERAGDDDRSSSASELRHLPDLWPDA